MPKKEIAMKRFPIPTISIEYKNDFHYQKFRYETEKRTGKKQHTQPMIVLEFTELQNPQIMNLCILAVSPNQPYCVHPNKLVGKDCSDGVYHITDVKKFKMNKKGHWTLEIPYLYICRTKKNAVKDSLQKIWSHIPSWLKELCTEEMNCDDNVKTDSIRLRVALDIDGVKFNELTSIITHHDSGEKVKFNIIDLSQSTFTSEDQRNISIFTEDNTGPDIKPGEYDVQIVTSNWKSEPYILQSADILYKRVIKFLVPECQDRDLQTCDVKGKIILRCLINDLTCQRDIEYTQSNVNRKRKILIERKNDVKRPCLERGPSFAIQDSDMSRSNNNMYTSASDNYVLFNNNSGKNFVLEQSTSKSAPQKQALESAPLSFKSAPFKSAPHTVTSDDVPMNQASKYALPAFSSNPVSQQPTSEKTFQTQEMGSDTSDLYLGNDDYNLTNNLSQGSHTWINAGSSNGISSGKIFNDSQSEDVYQDSPFPAELSNQSQSTSYKPQIEPVTPDIVEESAQLSGIATNSTQSPNLVEGESIKEVQLQSLDLQSLDFLKSGNFDLKNYVNLDSVDLANTCKELFKVTASDNPVELTQFKK